eukprot:CAMPEP_0178705304 /NCGR_PEP_ID=MMETSP0699-20121125/14704_1 /TAXON_ID=265572 /ORGANISM="Extubocellulus spinifer, Strain CCMP396" /LENGTH=354 /DNA_ID=CAMNT_0020352833 /DNA_START=559 /DNA_END=1619 /DNA_ORIENTATION=-
MPVFFKSAKERIGFTTKCNHSKYTGAKSQYSEWKYYVSEHAAASGWTGPNGILTFIHPDTGADITLYDDPTNITYDMMAQAAADRRNTVGTAQANLDALNSADVPDDDAIAIAESTLTNAQLADSSSTELLLYLNNSTTGAASAVLQRYQRAINGDGPTALWYIIHKTKPSALWGLESAREAINRESVLGRNGNVLDFLASINDQVNLIKTNGGTGDEKWLCAALLKGMSKSTDSEWLSIVAQLRREHKQDPIAYDSDRLISEADDEYRDLMAQRGFDATNPQSSPDAVANLAKQQDTSLTNLKPNLRELKQRFGSNGKRKPRSGRPFPGNDKQRASDQSAFPKGWNTVPPKPG